MQCFPSAQWIGGGKVFRGFADLPEQPAGPFLFRICGLGYFYFLCNGIPFETDELIPIQSNYRDTVYYTEYDLTAHLHPGRNEIIVYVGEGFYAQKTVNRPFYGWGNTFYGERRLCAELRDESQVLCATGPDWQTADGPFLADNVYAGEEYDAAREIGPATIWRNIEILPPPGGELHLQPIPGEKVYESLQPASLKELAPGHYLCDFGKNLTGRAAFTVDGPAGSTVQIRYAEELDEDNRIDFASTGVFATGVIPTDIYHLRGGGPESWHCRFGFRGGRFAEIRLSQGITLHEIHAEVIYSKLTAVGDVSGLDQPLTDCFRMMCLTLQGCLHSLPMDCPVREKCGWTGDAQVISHWAQFRFDLQKFWWKYMEDIRSSAIDGLPTMVAPGERIRSKATPDWGFACIAVPWENYCFTGDRDLLQKHYPMMLHFYEDCCARAKNDLLDGGLGDWCPPGSTRPHTTSTRLTTTAIWLESAQRLAEIAGILGHTAAAERFAADARRIAESFFKAFYRDEKTAFGSQTGNVLALQLHAMPPELEEAVAARLNAEITGANYHFNTGILGGKYLTNVLCRYGYADTAANLFRAKGYPGFQDLLRQGATTLWETWEKYPVDCADRPRSRNHVMQTGYAAFFFRNLGGLQIGPEFGGQRHLRYAPCTPAGVPSCKVEWQSIHGRIVSEWHRAEPDGPVQLRLKIPRGITVEFLQDRSLRGACPEIVTTGA